MIFFFLLRGIPVCSILCLCILCFGFGVEGGDGSVAEYLSLLLLLFHLPFVLDVLSRSPFHARVRLHFTSQFVYGQSVPDD